MNITATLPAEKFIQITSDDGGYLGARCLLCDASGWLDNTYGYCEADEAAGNKLIHKYNCQISKELYKRTSYKRRRELDDDIKIAESRLKGLQKLKADLEQR